MEKHKSITEGTRLSCFWAFNVDKKEMPGFLMISKNIHIAPPLFGVNEKEQEPKCYKEEKFLHSHEVQQMMDGQIVENTEIFKKVTNYMNEKWPNNFCFYNLSKQVIQDSENKLNQVMEYPFPEAVQVDYGSSPDPFCYKTAPPPLDALFLVAIEMSAWIT